MRNHHSQSNHHRRRRRRGFLCKIVWVRTFIVLVAVFVVAWESSMIGSFGDDEAATVQKSHNPNENQRMPTKDDFRRPTKKNGGKKGKDGSCPVPPEYPVYPKEPRKPLNYYLQKKRLVQDDVSSLLDTAIIGFPKTGSTSLTDMLSYHPEVHMKTWENNLLQQPFRAKVVRKLIQRVHTDNLTDGGKLLTSWKNPTDIYHKYAVPTLQEIFPSTKLIIGIRHPVLWFQSYYNFWESIADPEKGRNHLPPNTSELIGPCLPNVTELVCTDRARFHYYLARVMGKRSTLSATPSDREVELLGVNASVVSSLRAKRGCNPILLFEIGQVEKTFDERERLWLEDIRKFVGVKERFKKIIHHKPQNVWGKENVQTKINICEDSHASVRSVLMKHSRNTAAWIREFLMNGDNNVMISNKTYFEELLETYDQDPCELIGS